MAMKGYVNLISVDLVTRLLPGGARKTGVRDSAIVRGVSVLLRKKVRRNNNTSG